MVLITKLTHNLSHKVHHPRCVYNQLDWSVYTSLTQLYDGRDMYIIYYIKNNYMFRHFSLLSSGYAHHLLPHHCIQHTKVEYSCLHFFFIYQNEDGQ